MSFFRVRMTAASVFMTLTFAFPLLADKPVDVEKYRDRAVEKWAQAISGLDRRNQAETHPADSILFIGSSSIRRWDDISADVAPYHPIQRGFGGSRWSDVAVFANRLVTPHRFRAAVFFVGNDIAGKKDDKTPAEVVSLFAHVREVVRRHNPTAPAFYVAVTPTEKRWSAWSQIKSANEAVREYCAMSDNTYFIGTQSVFLDSQGRPRTELFVDDQLHLNRNGYVLWAAAIKSHLDSVLGGADVLGIRQ